MFLPLLLIPRISHLIEFYHKNQKILDKFLFNLPIYLLYHLNFEFFFFMSTS